VVVLALREAVVDEERDARLELRGDGPHEPSAARFTSVR
jgi:hypothetical protein